MGTRILASERTSQKLDELLTQSVTDGDARAELFGASVLSCSAFSQVTERFEHKYEAFAPGTSASSPSPPSS